MGETTRITCPCLLSSPSLSSSRGRPLRAMVSCAWAAPKRLPATLRALLDHTILRPTWLQAPLLQQPVSSALQTVGLVLQFHQAPMPQVLASSTARRTLLLALRLQQMEFFVQVRAKEPVQ